jgi:hypothetical protein
VIGLGAAAVVLVGAIALLLTRGDKKDEGAKPEPPPGVPAFLPPVEKPGDKVAWPAPSHRDFGLKFELAAVGPGKALDGVIPVTAGTDLVLHLTAEKDCRVAVWLIEPTGNILQVLPNEFDPDDTLKAGEKRVVGSERSRLEASVTGGAYDRLFVRAVVGDAPKYPPGVKSNQYTVYTTPLDRERLVATVRGIVIKKAGGGGPTEVSEAELRFRAK